MLVALLSMGFFVGASASYAAIHNDDRKHQVHAPVHSSICKWVMDSQGGLAKAVYKTPLPPAIPVGTVLLPAQGCFAAVLLARPLFRLALVAFPRQGRAPPPVATSSS